MQPMKLTGFERVSNVFAGKRVDRIPVAEDFWGETIDKWISEKHVEIGVPFVEHFDFDMDRGGFLNYYADLDFKTQKLEEDENTAMYLDGNGAKLRVNKYHVGGVQHVDFLVKDRSSWEKFTVPHLIKLDYRRIPFEEYRMKKEAAIKQGRHFSNDALGPFEIMQRLCGHENLLLNMALDPGFVKDMALTYSELNIRHWEILFDKEGLPDSTWIAEDLGYKHKPFMSPKMFIDVLLPAYVKMFDYLHSKGLKVIMHSCGYIEPLLPALIDAGLDCLEAMEFKAGMNMLDLFAKYGNSIVYFGNIDVRVLESNDISCVKNELYDKICPIINQGGRYILHSDHSISPKVEYSTFCHYLEIAREICV